MSTEVEPEILSELPYEYSSVVGQKPSWFAYLTSADVGELVVLQAALWQAAAELRHGEGKGTLGFLMVFSVGLAGALSINLVPRLPPMSPRSPALPHNQPPDAVALSPPIAAPAAVPLSGGDRSAPPGAVPAAASDLPSRVRDNTDEAAPLNTRVRSTYVFGGELLYFLEGVTDGALGIVRDPLLGAQSNGMRGFVRGIGSGLVGTITRPTRGLLKAGSNAYSGMEGLAGRNTMRQLPDATNQDPPDIRRRRIPARLRRRSKAPAANPKEDAVLQLDDSLSAGPVDVDPQPQDPAQEGVCRSPAQRNWRGLAVGVGIVPLICCAMYLNLSAQYAAPVPSETAGPAAAGVCVSAASPASRSAGDRLAEAAYAEALLEAAVLCSLCVAVAVWQGSQAYQDRYPALGCAPARLVLLVAVAVGATHYPLFCLWCVALCSGLLEAVGLFGERTAWRLGALSLRPGEAVLLCQALTLGVMDAALYTLQKALGISALDGIFPRAPGRSQTVLVVQSGVLGTLATGWLMAPSAASGGSAMRTSSAAPVPFGGYGSSRWRTARTYGLLAAGIGVLVLGWMHLLLGRPRGGPLAWVMCQLTRPPHEYEGPGCDVEVRSAFGSYSISGRVLLCGYWVCVMGAALPLISLAARTFGLQRVVVRKLFHALATLMFLPAAAADPEFLALALAVALCALLVLEYLRCSNTPPLATGLTAYYKGFVDERDGGAVFVTHLYLLLGCAAPLWLSWPLSQRERVICHFLGTIVLGVGDAMGAVVGLAVGTHRWPGSRRTLEGSLAMFAFTCVSLVLVAPSGVSVKGLIWPAVLTTLMEAFTTQVDNLVLPCFAFSLILL